MRATIILYSETRPPENVSVIVDGAVYVATPAGKPTKLTEGDYECTWSIGQLEPIEENR